MFLLFTFLINFTDRIGIEIGDVGLSAYDVYDNQSI